MDEDVDRATRTRDWLMVVGLLGLVAGGVLVGANWPGLEAPTSSALLNGDQDMVVTGSETWRNVGWVVMGLAQLPLFVALIAFGVSIGIRSSRV